MKKFLVIYLGLIVMLLFSSCWENEPYYSSLCGFDCKKIPLIESCYISTTSGVDGKWFLSGCPGEYVRKVSSINVLDSVIISYYFIPYIIVPENRDSTWYIHIPSQNQEYKFTSKEEFYEQVAKFTDKPVELYTPATLYREYGKKGYLDWFPEEHKNRMVF